LLGWLVMSLAIWAWHVPAAFELALVSRACHVAEHATFLGAGLLFWWPVVRPWPFHARWSRSAMIPYLLLADIQNTALAAILVFSDRVLYPSYAGPGALADQVLAGLLMWVPMSLAYLVPAAVLTARWLSPDGLAGAWPSASLRSPGAQTTRRFGGGQEERPPPPRRGHPSARSRKGARPPAGAANATGSRESRTSTASRTAAAFSAPNAATHTSAAP